jgi:hypothetical protein
MGRKPLGDRPLTPGERQQRWRVKKRAAKQAKENQFWGELWRRVKEAQEKTKLPRPRLVASSK